MNYFAAGCFFILLLACKNETKINTTSNDAPSLTQSIKHGNPDWDDNAVMYEVNIRQYTPEGTFNAFSNHVERLAQMGVDVLWFMPIFPISAEKRKGSLGSYYSVTDFLATNSEFGTKADFKKLVDKIHANSMKVIIDWVPNHTGWGHVWIKSHPEYYTQDSLGNIIDPIDPQTGKSWGWTDVADLNYNSAGMRQAQIDAMQYWISDFDIDGFRYDVAHNVPADFWQTVSDTLRRMKSVLLLGESQTPQFRNEGALDVDYGWNFHHLCNDIAQGKKKAYLIDSFLAQDANENQKGYHIYFTSNHDENSWQGTEFERMKDAAKTMAVLNFTFDGMPLLYSGQEEPLKKRLRFFDKDTIHWSTYSFAPFYKSLFDLKQRSKALGNGNAATALKKIIDHKDIYAFKKEKDGQAILVILNLSAKKQTGTIKEDIPAMQEIFTQKSNAFKKDQKINLNPWEYQVYSTN
ncbi:MAG: alpha-amylase [Saprospiraceae bacterium]|nr:alpha-amylase [Saprospiraceae bacterium]